MPWQWPWTPAPPSALPDPEAAAAALLTREDGIQRLVDAALTREDVLSQVYAAFANRALGTGGPTDVTQQLRPQVSTPLTELELQLLYIQGLPRRICTLYPQWVLRGAPEPWVVHVEGDRDEAVLKHMRHLGVDSVLAQADEWARAFGGAGVFIDTDDGAPLWEPLVVRRGTRIRRLVPLDGYELRPCEWQRLVAAEAMADPAQRQDNRYQPRYGRATKYQLTQRRGGTVLYIHWTRILDLYGAPDLPYYWGEAPGANLVTQAWGARSWIQVAWEAIRQSQNLAQSADRAGQKASTWVANVVDAQAIQVADATSYTAMLQKLANMIGRGFVAGRPGMQIEAKGLTLSGFKDLTEGQQARVAAETGIPLALLYGQAPPGFSSDESSWWTQWVAQIAAYRPSQYEPPLRRLADLLCMAHFGTLCEVGIEWGTLSEADQVETATARKLHTEADVLAVDAGFVSVGQVQRGRYGEEGWRAELPPPTPEEEAPAATGVNPGPATPTGALGAEAPTADAEPDGLAERRTLAAQMTEHDIERCPHDRPNRCPQCGIERVRGIAVDENGEIVNDEEGRPRWTVAWRALGVTPREDAETYKVPEAARNNARKVLRWREEHGDDVKGMTETGWRRARQLATQSEVGRETVAAMAAFNRHRQNAEVSPEFRDEPWRDAGYVAWLGWGGTTGIDWARSITGADEE